MHGEAFNLIIVSISSPPPPPPPTHTQHTTACTHTRLHEHQSLCSWTDTYHLQEIKSLIRCRLHIADAPHLHSSPGSKSSPCPCRSQLLLAGRAMELARECLKIWGYDRVDELIWVKTNQLQRLIRTGRTGHWLNHSKEHCLVGIKGKPALNRWVRASGSAAQTPRQITIDIPPGLSRPSSAHTPWFVLGHFSAPCPLICPLLPVSLLNSLCSFAPCPSMCPLNLAFVACLLPQFALLFAPYAFCCIKCDIPWALSSVRLAFKLAF
eukprot:1161282-Pelagomonas_calceolata.AAC.18